MKEYLEWLQNIFAEDLCNGDWEHGMGISISTLDNPGWAFRFSLKDTDLENLSFTPIEVEVDENNWYMCRVRNQVFEGAGGPKNLTDIFKVFQAWYIETLPKKDA
jgi:hypothetical protein